MLCLENDQQGKFWLESWSLIDWLPEQQSKQTTHFSTGNGKTFID